MKTELSPNTTERFRELRSTRDPDTRAALITEHLPLVDQLARRFANRSETFDDLRQAGAVGLIKAVEGFDPDLGFEFSAYATRTIIGELKRHFRDRAWSVRAPRRIQELYLALGATVEELSQRLGRSPTITELAAETGAGEEEVIEALEAGNAYRSTSLDSTGPEGEVLSSRLGEEDEGFDLAEVRGTLVPQLRNLTEREQLIIELRFIEDLTQTEIAQRVGLSQMHVSRLLTKTLQRLRDATDDAGVEF